MGRIVRSLRYAISPAGLSATIVLSWLATAGVSTAEDQVLPYGRWTVIAQGFGWPCRLEALEIRESNRVGEALLVGFDRGEAGRSQFWGSSRIDRKAGGPSVARWFSASWPSGSSTILVELRPEGPGRLLAVIRERSKELGVGDRVRQVILAPVPVDERPVVDGGARPRASSAPPVRFDVDGAGTSKVPLSGIFVARADGSGARPVALPDGFATASHPCWSPDGKWVAFAGFDASGRSPLIRVASTRGGPSTAIAAGITPSWSRDGSRIAYVASGRADYATDWSSPGRNEERIEAVTLSARRPARSKSSPAESGPASRRPTIDLHS